MNHFTPAQVLELLDVADTGVHERKAGTSAWSSRREQKPRHTTRGLPKATSSSRSVSSGKAT